MLNLFFALLTLFAHELRRYAHRHYPSNGVSGYVACSLDPADCKDAGQLRAGLDQRRVHHQIDRQSAQCRTEQTHFVFYDVT